MTYYMNYEETNPLSELGVWKDVLAYPLYQISSAGAFMNKRTLKMLKHFRHKEGNGPSVITALVREMC